MTSQGCADVGVCYPPQVQKVEVRLAGFSPGASGPLAAAPQGATSPAAPSFGGREVRGEPAIVSDESRFEQALLSGGFLLTLAIFFGAGILLTFTPCVLPMIPILSGIIVGENRAVAKAHAFALSVTYVLGMAVTYAAIGVIAALSGAFISAALQNPWVLAAFAAIFVVLALSMFGFYDLQLPSALHSKAHAASAKLRGGELGAVALMGMLSAAIVSPCVAAPLAGALLYISQTRDAVLGGAALFSLALGMGVPLVVVGTAEGALLPKSARAMSAVKKFFGWLLLGVAIWIVSPIIPVAAQMLAWAALLIVGAVYLHALDPLPHDASGYARLWKGVGVIALVAGAALVIGALSGARDPLQPLAGLRAAEAPGAPAGEVRFERVGTAGPAGCAAQDREPAGDARFLRRLVRVVQGNGALHLQRSAWSGPSSRRWCCCRSTSRRTPRRTRRCSSATGSSARRESSSSTRPGARSRACASSASSRPTSSSSRSRSRASSEA